MSGCAVLLLLTPIVTGRPVLISCYSIPCFHCCGHNCLIVGVYIQGHHCCRHVESWTLRGPSLSLSCHRWRRIVAIRGTQVMKSLPLAASLSVGGEKCGGRYWYWCSAAAKVLLDRWSQSNRVARHPTNYNKLQQGNIIKARVCGEPTTYPRHVRHE